MKPFVSWTVGMFVAVGLIVTPLSVVQAQLISNQQVAEQKREVLFGLVEAMQEHVKLLQMLVIQKLEADVALLQARLDAQSK